MTQNSHFRPEPRFYPSYPMKVDVQHWRTLSLGERVARGFAYNGQIRVLLFERIEAAHPDWSHEQHQMMFFRLSYAGEHFDEFAQAKITRGDWRADEVEAVRGTPIPLDRTESAKYTAISHPDIDEAANSWPNASERGTNT